MESLASRGRNRVQEALARERESQCFELRKAGATFAVIGRQLGITAYGAETAYRRALKRYPSQAQVEEHRTLVAARYDSMLVPIWPRAIKGDLAAIDRVLKIEEARRTMLGLDVPQPKNDVQFIKQLFLDLRSLPESDLLNILGYGDVVEEGARAAGPALPPGEAAESEGEGDGEGEGEGEGEG